MELYNKQNISKLNIDNEKFLYLKALITNNLNFYIDNCDAEIILLEHEGLYIPLIVTDNIPNQTYLTSLISSYITYPKQILNNKFVNLFFDFFSNILTYFNMDKVIYVNHYLISTNINYEFSDKQISDITTFLKQKFPDYAICFRNIAHETNETLFNSLKYNKFRFLINRCSYYIDSDNLKNVFKKQSLKKDLSLSKKGKYKISNSVTDISQQAKLYNDLYINKYTEINPKYNKEFIKMLKDSGFESYSLLNKQNEIVGFYVPFVFNNTVSVPWFGYDTSLSQKDGLYRLLMLNIIEYAKNNNLNLNLSSGVGEFKQRRGAKPYWEYLAIDYSHLNIVRKILYFVLIEITNKISFPLAKFFNIKFF